MSNIRYFITQGRDSAGYTDETTLTRALLTEPDKISPVLTHLLGRESNKFPLTFLSEGQKGGRRTIEINDTEYYWDVMAHLTNSDFIANHSYSGSDKPGLNFMPFQVMMKTNWLRENHTVHTPNGMALRVQGIPTKVGAQYLYTFILLEGTADSYVPLTEIAIGGMLGMVGAAAGPASHSFGNSSNVETPGKMKNQVTLIRKSYELAGNISNKYVNVEFKLDGGATTKRWIDFERWQHMIKWNQACEEEYWYSKYNRQADGRIMHIDEATGKPIPKGAGVLDQIPHRDTYSNLTLERLKNTITDVFYGASDVENMKIVMFTGEGGREEFHNAIMSQGTGFSAWTGDISSLFVNGTANGNNLMFGAYFNAYKHVNGHVVMVVTHPMYDHGGQAEIAPKHYQSGRSLESYRMTFVDATNYDGQNNLVMVTERGRSMKTGILKGMADTPYDFGGNNEMNIATDQDKSSVHFLATKGICIRRNTHCFDLQCDAAA